MRYKVIAVDFDGTICYDKYPFNNGIDPKAVEVLNKFRSNGGELILWTCRHSEYLDRAVEVCKEAGLEFDAINSQAPNHTKEFEKETGIKGCSPKVYADFYIDDHSRLDGKVDWDRLDKEING